MRVDRRPYMYGHSYRHASFIIHHTVIIIHHTDVMHHSSYMIPSFIIHHTDVMHNSSYMTPSFIIRRMIIFSGWKYSGSIANFSASDSASPMACRVSWFSLGPQTALHPSPAVFKALQVEPCLKRSGVSALQLQLQLWVAGWWLGV